MVNLQSSPVRSQDWSIVKVENLSSFPSFDTSQSRPVRIFHRRDPLESATLRWFPLGVFGRMPFSPTSEAVVLIDRFCLQDLTRDDEGTSLSVKAVFLWIVPQRFDWRWSWKHTVPSPSYGMRNITSTLELWKSLVYSLLPYQRTMYVLIMNDVSTLGNWFTTIGWVVVPTVTDAGAQNWGEQVHRR